MRTLNVCGLGEKIMYFYIEKNGEIEGSRGHKNMIMDEIKRRMKTGKYDLKINNGTEKAFSLELSKDIEEKLMEMKRHGEPMFWHDNTDRPHMRGISAMQFIETSNIVVHALELLKTVFVNIFSCKEFDTKAAEEFTKFFSKQKK